MIKELKNKFLENIKNGEDIKNIVEGMNEYFKECKENEGNAKELIQILQNINEYFLRNYNIYIDKDLIIRPIETEIYFANAFCHGACHENDRQKDPFFGKIYFHRKGKTNNIDFIRGGMDICISKGDYYLSILIRSAYFNKDKEPVIGIRNIVDKILKYKEGEKATIIIEKRNNKEKLIDQEKKYIQQKLEHLESIKNILEKKEKSSSNKVEKHRRIKNKEYFSSYNKLKNAELNCFFKEEQEKLAEENNIYDSNNFQKK